jgi:hypothetical protein
MTSAIWFAIGAGLVALVAAALIAGGRARRPDLGSVSDQWIAQHRAGQTNHTQY